MFKNLFVVVLLCFAFFKLSTACTAGSVRLFNGTSTSDKGTVQVCNSTVWSDVCDYRWGITHSRIVCKQLGYTKAPVVTINKGAAPTGKFSFVTRSSTCSYTTIASCLTSSSFYLNYNSYCSLSRDTVHIDCNADTSGGTPGDIRLYNTTTRKSSNSGMVQIADTTGKWCGVCDFNWGCDEAVTACKQLGNSNPFPTYSINAGGWTKLGFGPYRTCSATATNLTACSKYSSYYRSSSYYCNLIRDTVLLTCNNNQVKPTCSPNLSVRLVGGSNASEGRVEVCHAGYWKSFCGRSINQKFASAVCNQLGYTSNNFAAVITDGRYGCGNISSYITYTYCRSNQVYNHIKYCSITSPSNGRCLTDCTSSCTGIKCPLADNCNEGAVRLANGTMAREGRLEVCVNGVWGAVCSSGFRRSAAYVACKQAGYNDSDDAIIYTYSSKYGTGDRPIVYSNVDCFGSESRLVDCRKQVFPSVSCSNTYIIGLKCLDVCTEGQIRLVGGENVFAGTVEICIEKRWKLVSENGWGDVDARVVCRQLSHRGGKAVLNSLFGTPKRAIVYSNVNCRGSETQLRDCTHSRLRPERTKGGVAGVRCDAQLVPQGEDASIVTSLSCNSTSFALQGCSQVCSERTENCIGSKLTDVGKCVCTSCTESRTEPSMALTITLEDARHYRCNEYCKRMKKCFDGTCDRSKNKCVCRFCPTD